ncbi:MAG: hypothetical protein DDT29_02117 [Dehalococcoidia bacterium]|nr:hypothetical protein [Bacillota bacterium]
MTKELRGTQATEKKEGGEMKYAKIQIATGAYARIAGLYQGSQFILDRGEEDYDDGFWIIPEKDYAEWYSNFEMLYRALEEAEPLD